jgi:SAM-dependent methyltransferase
MKAMTPEECVAAERALTGPVGGALAHAMFERALGRVPVDEDGVAAAGRLGWIDAQLEFTPLGALVKDPLREFGFWRERGGKLPSEHVAKALAGPRYAFKRVLEVGCGGGCNLLSLRMLTTPPSRIAGVEPMPVYVQMASMLARVAGLEPPEIVRGSAESLSFEDGSFDVLLCYSSHQYMDVDRSLHEMARVLSPGGELLVVGNSLVPFAVESAERFARSRDAGTLRSDVKAVANTLSYQLRGRRIRRARKTSTTGAPIYPTLGHMRRRMRAAGFVLSAHGTQGLPTRETVFVAIKR